MVSGIGGASALKKKGIKVRHDNPNVGANLSVCFLFSIVNSGFAQHSEPLLRIFRTILGSPSKNLDIWLMFVWSLI